MSDETQKSPTQRRRQATRHGVVLPGLAGMSAEELTARTNAKFGGVTPETITARIRALCTRR